MENAYQMPAWIYEQAKKIRDWADEQARGCLESLMPELEKQYISKAEALRMGERMTQRTAAAPGGLDALAIPAGKLIWAPKADVAPVSHGKWEYDERDNKVYCDWCGMASSKSTPYCPYCGAKMDNMVHNDIPKNFNFLIKGVTKNGQRTRNHSRD